MRSHVFDNSAGQRSSRPKPISAQTSASRGFAPCWPRRNSTCNGGCVPGEPEQQEGKTMIGFKKILFPTDFSRNADKALAHAIRLAEFDKGEVIVQHVVGNYFEPHSHWATLYDLHELQKYMDGYVDGHMKDVVPADTGNVRIRTVISKGKPAEEIAALATDEMVDLVVMGSAKGAVTNKVIRLTSRPVLAVSANQPGVREAGLQKLTRIL